MQISAELYPFAGRIFERRGLRYHYLDEGPQDGEPVVMVHGNPSWSFMYRDLVKRLRPRYRTVVPDHIGCGFSDKPGDEAYAYTLAERRDDLEALLAEVVPTKKVTLVLHDWGGMIGMAWAARHLERVGRIVLLNTAAFHLPAHRKLPASLAFMRDSWVGAFAVRGLNAMSLGATFACARRPLDPAVRAAYAAPYDSWKNRIATLRFVQDIPLCPGDRAYDAVSEVEASLSSFTHVPVMMCWGAKDFVFDSGVLAMWQERWPHAEAHVFKEAGHYVLEDAGDAIGPLVERFLDAHPLA
jgi:haloalkane dehalogenase